MQNTGGYLAKHYRELALMGIWEVLKNINKFRNFIRNCKNEILNFSPDVLILIDYAGFNLRIAKFGKENNIPVYYYISPKLWAWGKSRAKLIRRYVEKMYVILPFEVDFYRKLQIKAKFLGNPVTDEIEKFIHSYNETNSDFRVRHHLTEKPIIALLAGSRKQEIDLCLPEMLRVVNHFTEFQFILAGARSISKDYYSRFLIDQNVTLIYDETYPLLKNSVAAVVTSGTATLETALIDIPQVVVYKTSWPTFFLGRILILIGIIHVKFFSLVNIILDRELVKEFFQFSLSGNTIKELDKILKDKHHAGDILRGYKEIRQSLLESGASSRFAQEMVKSLKEKSL